MATHKLLLLPGDGIGPEVMGEVEKIVRWFDTQGIASFAVERDLVGGAAYDDHGEAISHAAMDRAQAAVLNVVKCRPPGNRTPKTAEVARCSGWLRRQLELLDPPVVVALGLSSAKWFLGPRTVLAQARGRAHEVDGRAVWATYHPSAAIRFGPNGAPRAGLLADLTAVAGTLA